MSNGHRQHPLTAKYDLSSLRNILSGAAPLAADVEVAVEKKFKSVSAIFSVDE